MASSSIQYRRSATHGTPIPSRLVSMTSNVRQPNRPQSSATSIDAASDYEDSRKRPAHGWQARKQNIMMRPMAEEERDVSDAESFDSLTYRAKFMSDMLSDSDSSSIDGRHSIVSYGPPTPRTPSPEYMEEGFPVVEIMDEKSPRSSRASSMEASPAFAAKVKAMTTVGPRGPHLFRSYSTTHTTNISHITIPSPRSSLPPTPSLTDASRSPSLHKLPDSPLPTPRVLSARGTPKLGSSSPRYPSSPRLPQSPRVSQHSPHHTPRSESEAYFGNSRPVSGEDILIAAEDAFDIEEVRTWSPNQVCAWMAALGFEQEMVEKFAKNDISGAILIDLKWEDLKELDIQSFGKRTELWTEIVHLRARGIPTPDRAEFIRTSSRIARSNSTISAANSRARSGSSTSVASQMIAVPEDDQTIVGYGPRTPLYRTAPPTPLPQTVHKPMVLPSNVSDADDDERDDGVQPRNRPVVRRRRRTNVRMPQRQVAVDSIIITSDEEFPGSYIAKIEAMTSYDQGRPMRRNMSKRDSVTPSDSISIRGRKPKKPAAATIQDLTKKPHKCKKGDKCRKHGKAEHPTLPSRPKSEVRSEHGTILIATTPSIADFSGMQPAIPQDSPRTIQGSPRTLQGSPRPQSGYTSPSVIASSDALGQIQSKEIKLKESVLREVSRLDPQESVRQFVNYQHLQHLEEARSTPPPVPTKAPVENLTIAPRRPSPPPPAPRKDSIGSIMPPHPVPTPQPYPSHPSHASYQRLPPSVPHTASTTNGSFCPPAPSPTMQRSQTPSFGLRIQGMEQVVPPHGNFAVPSRVRSPGMMRTTTPFSEADVPCPTGTPINFRDQSQSVPPELHYRRFPTPTIESLTAPIVPRGAGIQRSQSTRPTLNMVEESAEWEVVEDGEVKIAPSPSMRTHSGWMKKRRTNWFRHEWPDYHFVLRGTRLGYARDVATGEVGSIDMDQYQVACSNSGSTKLSAAFKSGKIFGKKKEDGVAGSYFFQLVPADGPGQKGKKNIGKVHCFAVGSREERIDWMRELMLAKAIKQKGQGFEVEVNGEKV